MLRPMPLPAALLCVVASALAIALTFPPWSLRPLAFVGLVPLLLAIRSGGMPRALSLATAWALISAGLIASVFPASIASYFERPLWFGLLTALAVFLLTAGVYYAAFAALDRVLIRRFRAWTPLLVASAWVVLELARGRLFTGTAFFIGNPWGLIGYSHASGALAQIASLCGVYGIGFTIVAVNAGFAGLIGAWPRLAARRVALAGLGLALLPVFASAIWGAAVLRAAPAPGLASGLREVALVQGDVSIDRRWRSDFHGKNLDVYLELTRTALREGSPELVIWPETALNFFVEDERAHRTAIMDTLADGPAALVVGGPSASAQRQAPYFNSVFLIEPDRGVVGRYDKAVLVPFSEYLPGSGLDWTRRRIDGPRFFDAGPARPPPLETSLGRVGVLICNEAMLPEIAGDRVRAGAEILISPSNDTWIEGRAFAEHMLAVVALRSIETRRYLVRVSTAGPSAVVDPWGRVVTRTDAGMPAARIGRIRPERSVTAYTRVGDAFAGACLAVVATALLAPIAIRRVGRRES